MRIGRFRLGRHRFSRPGNAASRRPTAVLAKVLPASLVAVLLTVLVAVGSPPADAAPLSPSPYTYYRERLRGDTMTVEHAPPAPGTRVAGRLHRAHRALHPRRHRTVAHRLVRRRVVHRRAAARRYAANPAIAGFCRDGGLARRLDAGRPIVVQREVCDSIGYTSTNPNALQRRPDEFTKP